METSPIASRFLYDALSFTSKNPSHDLGFVIDLLGLHSVSFTHIHGAKGYEERDYFDGININYGSDDPDKFLWVELSGQGCRAFETYGNGDYETLFDWILNTDGVQITRLDIAFDDREGLLQLSNVVDGLRNYDYVSPFKKWEVSDDSDGGCTIYIGSKKSDFFFRIYDKAIERGYLDRSCGPWVRIEAQLRHDRADAWLIGGHTPFDLIGLLSGYIRFIDPDRTDTNKRRAQNAPWWNDFVATATKIKLFSKPGVEYNIDNLTRFVFGMSGPSIYCAVETLGLVRFLSRLRDEAEERALNNPKFNKFFTGKKVDQHVP
jgi:phage replication initiation protein